MNSPIGDSWTRVDGVSKVTGQATYAADVSPSGTLWGKVLRSPFAHALIKSINIERATSMPGVRAVVTGRDFPFLHGECLINIPFLAIDKVRYEGEPVVAVAADDLTTAEEALDLVEVTYEELPSIFDPEEAIKRESPLIHEKLGEYQAISAVKVIPGTNICQHFTLSLGDCETAFQESDYIFNDRFTTPQVQHAAIEPHASIAMVDATGRITIWGQNDSPHRARKEIAQALGISQAMVRVVTGYVGGNFGGKGGLKSEAIAIALARKVRGRPVKVLFTREEVFKTITRSGCIIYLKTGVRKDGTLLTRQIRLIWDIGAYAEKGPTISLHGGALAAGPYTIPNVQVESFTVFTNKPMAGAMRGYGLPQVSFAYESQMDIIAEKLGISPLDIRLKNAVTEGSKVTTGQRLYGVGLKECLETIGRELYQYSPKNIDTGNHALPYGHWVRGIGMACSYSKTKTPTVSSAYVKIDEDGSAGIVTSTVEVGQGSHTIMTQIVAEILGLPKDQITVSMADTDTTPYDTSTTASRTTFHMGHAVRMAAEDAREQLLVLAAPFLNVEKGILQLQGGNVVCPDGHMLSIAQVLKAHFGAGAGAAVLGKGLFTPKDILGLEDIGDVHLEAFSAFSVFHNYAAQGAEVLVDLDTGLVKVLRLVAAHDVGKAINHGNCLRQVEGALAMGLGYGLLEEYLWEAGQIANADFHGYKIPTALDCPSVDIFLVEIMHPHGPFGAKGMGEMASSPTAPVIANAVFNACGARVRDLPLTAAKILKALHTNKQIL